MKEKNHKEPTSFFRMENIMYLWSHFASQGEKVVTIDAHIREMIKRVKLVYVFERCMSSLP